jgi:putative transposase
MRVRRTTSRRSTKVPPGTQRHLPFTRTWGGQREGAGRKPAARRAGVAHRVRPEHKARHPVHVTLRAGQRLPSLRGQLVFFAIRRALTRASRGWFRLLHFSVQSDHVHLLVEAHDQRALSRGMAGLAIRVARAVNRLLRRRGRFWSDRYHARSLRTPREVRNGIVYVLTNWMKHRRGFAMGLDPRSSSRWFDGWKVLPDVGPLAEHLDECPVVGPRTWLAREGWRRHGLISSSETPKEAHLIR